MSGLTGDYQVRKKSGILIWVLCLLVVSLPAATGIAAGEKAPIGENILILYPYMSAGPYIDAVNKGFFAVWDQYGLRANIFVEHRDSIRNPGRIRDEQFLRYLTDKYAGMKLSAIVVPHAAVIPLAAELRSVLALDCPIFTAELNRQDLPSLLYANQYRLLLNLEIEKTIASAKEFEPRLSRVMIVATQATLDHYNIREYIQSLDVAKGSIQINFPLTDSVENTASVMRNLTPQDALVFIDLLPDPQGRIDNVAYWNELLAQGNKAPVYCVLDFFKPGQPVGDTPGTFVGGYLLEPYLIGQEMAKIVVSTLTGEPPRERTIPVSVSRPVYDYRGLERFGYLSRQLPAGAVVVNKPFSFYETYRELVLGTLAAFGILILYIALLLANIRRRRAAEQVLKTANRDLAAMYSKISEAEKALQAQYDELKAKDTEIRESELRFQLAIEAAEDAIFDVEVDSGRFLALSRTDHGMQLPSIANTQELIAAIHPDDRPARQKALDEYIQGKTALYETEYRIRSAAGDWIWAMVRGQAIRDNSGEPIRLVGAMTDISHLKEASAALERRVAERTRELAQAMSELEAFTYTVSHDIKSPLRAIAGYADLLREDNSHQLNGQSLAMLSSIQCITADMIELVNRLLEYSTTSRLTLKMESVDMSNLFVTVYNELAAQEANRQVVMRLEGDWPVVWGDRVLLRQVWTNVLANAFKFTRTRPRAEITVACQRTGDEYVFSVRDNGVGFDPHYTDKLFGIFERLHSAKEFPGHGIGLATVQKIIHKHGGRVWIAGEVDRGATVAFTLPVNPEQ